MMCKFYTGDIDIIADVLVGFILTWDPSLELSDAADVGQETIMAMYRYYKHNGIKYLFGQRNGDYTLVISVLQK